jgi:hypothetical protein
MADKVGQWEQNGLGIFRKDAADDELGLICLGQIDNSTEEALANIKEIVALHNAALDINPSNPMAVAENIEQIMRLFRKIEKQCGWLYKTDYRAVKHTLAAITKPATGD